MKLHLHNNSNGILLSINQLIYLFISDVILLSQLANVKCRNIISNTADKDLGKGNVSTLWLSLW